MAITYKDINQLTQKSSVAGTEKLPVSDTQYITPAQIAAGSIPKVDEDGYSIASLDGFYEGANDQFFALPGSDFAADAPAGSVVLANDANVVHKTGNESIAGTKTFTGDVFISSSLNIASESDAVLVADSVGFGWIVDDNGDTVQDKLNAKQATLVSGTNIKTVNGTSLLGSGNISTEQVFIATYGTTTYQDVETAYLAGKAV